MRDIQEIASRTAAGIALAYRSGEAGPVEVTECLLERIEKSSDTSIFITVTAERARAEARRSQARYKAGEPLSALDGVPIAWKDLIDIAGAPTTAGSALFGGGPVKTQDLECAANAAASGMVCLGKLNLTELAYSGLGLNPHYGTPVNPNDKTVKRAPGGSSSGSGVAVAAKLVPCAVGSDTGGSVRIPAAFNGVVGYKSSRGRIETRGLVALSRTLDTIGPLARSVEDCVLVDMAMRGAVTADARRTSLRSLTVVSPTNFVLDAAEPAVLENYERALSAIEKAGATVRREAVPTLNEIAELTAQHGTLTAAEAYNEYREIIDSAEVNRIDRRVVKRILDGKRMSANDLLSIQRGRQRLISQILAQLGGALLVMPTTPITAPAIEPLERDDEMFHRINLLALRNTMLGNVLDLCGLALPSGRDANGMPTSILFSAAHGEDDRLLGCGLEIERVIREMLQAAS